MNIYQNRLDTFRSNQSHWLHSKTSILKIENFAKAGFFLCKKRKEKDNVKCFLCDVELSNWTSKQPPFIRHATESPSCPWVLLDYPDSRMLTAGTGNTSPKGSLMKTARMATFSASDYWPPKKIGNVRRPRLQPVSTMVEAGFYYSPTLEHPLRIRCPYCHFSIIQPDLDLNILNDHKQTKTQCPFFKSSIGIKARLMNKPTHPEPIKKKRKISEASSEENDPKKKEADFDSSIWDIKHALGAPKPDKTAKVLKTYSKRKNKHRKHDDEFGPLLTYPAEAPQENILDDEAFHQFNTELLTPNNSKSKQKQKGKEKEGSSQQHNLERNYRISSTHSEELKQTSRPDKEPQKITVISSPGNETQERAVPISPFRQGRTSRPSKKLSIASSSSSSSSSSSKKDSLSKQGQSFPSLPKKDSLSRTRQSSSSYSLSKKDSFPRERAVTPPLPSDNTLRKRSLLMQSTPNQSSIPLSAFNIFGDGVFSPIVGNEPIRNLVSSSRNEPSTPLPFSSRTHELINENNQLKQLKRPRSPTRSDAETNDMMQMKAIETITKKLYEDELTEEEKKMTVADYIKSSIEKEIQKIRDYGEERIKEIKRRSEELKQEIINSQD